LRVAVIGGGGFVGSAFVRHLDASTSVDLVSIDRSNYSNYTGSKFDVVIDASCNSNKRLADQDPVREFDLSATQRLRTLRDFPAELQVHISSVDIYSDLASSSATHEDSHIDVSASSNYGLHKLFAEAMVQHYAPRWLIVRLAGMVGDRLKKNPVFDILNGRPLFIHPDSQYQFMDTGDVARLTMDLVLRGLREQIVNVCGEGLVSPRQVAAIAGRKIEVSPEARDATPRIVDVNIGKLKQLCEVPASIVAVTEFVSAWDRAAEERNV
jgi:nucleoside-diphosphate-sugar epimerase